MMFKRTLDRYKRKIKKLYLKIKKRLFGKLCRCND
jgi:hypothetical protein